MQLKTLLENKKKYLAYNRFRKGIFEELAPRDSEVILYLLPWMLSVNSPAVPGYIEKMKRPWKVSHIDAEREVLSREPAFKRRFEISSERSLLKQSSSPCWIEGLYTIGSIGSIAQTSRSDCDIWVCVNRSDTCKEALEDLSRKMNLIKDWLDQHVRIPIYFFLSDTEDIRLCRFGIVEGESSGSAQRQVLKEEFYRTTSIIGGKIPLWWLCGSEGSEPVDYEAFAESFRKGRYAGEYDLIDLGNIETVDRDEYFGAALWQFNKAMTHPLKSIIKMLLLKMLLESPREELLCHRFRRTVLECPDGEFLDPATFTLQAMLEYYRDLPEETFAFIQECFYLRYDISLWSKRITIREKLTRDIFKQYGMTRETITRLNSFASWNFQEQSGFGDRVFELLKKIYRDIAGMERGVQGAIAPDDLRVMGGKLSACLEKKTSKVPIIHRPLDSPIKPTLVFKTVGKVWYVHAAGDPSAPIVESPDIVSCIAYLIWNDLFVPTEVRMLPNATSITLQEIVNLGKKMRDFFGISDIAAVEFANYLEDERISKALIVLNFETTVHVREIRDLRLVWRNSWGELFVKRWTNPSALREFLDGAAETSPSMEIQYYVQRSSFLYEKVIDRAKRTATTKFLS